MPPPDPENLLPFLPLAEESGPWPAFAKSIGMDFIITQDNEIFLIEIQHGFGRRGLRRLFGPAAQRYRRIYRQLLRRYEGSTKLLACLRPLSNDKINTYRALSHFQPSSCPYYRWTPKVAAWLDRVPSELVVAKPPTGTCGRGIVVLPRDEFRRDHEAFRLDRPMLLQEFVESRKLEDREGLAHVGCIRHIMILHCDSRAFGLIHFPSYWRVSPSPYIGLEQEEGLTANISRGAYPEPLAAEEVRPVRRMAEQVALAAIQKVLDLPSLELGPCWTISETGVLAVDS